MFRYYVLQMQTGCLAFLFCCLASIGNAYVLPPSFIVQQMGQKYASEHAPNKQWQAMITFEQKTAAAVAATMKLTKDGLSFALAHKEAEKIDLHFLDAQWACRAKNATLCTELLNNYFTKAGIDSSVVGLAIVDNEPAYIIGALPGDFTSPQVWIDKENLLPVKERTAHDEITWSKWIENAALSFPRLIKVKTATGEMSIANG